MTRIDTSGVPRDQQEVARRYQRLLLIEWLREAYRHTIARPGFDAFQDAKVIGGLANVAATVLHNLNKEHSHGRNT